MRSATDLRITYAKRHEIGAGQFQRDDGLGGGDRCGPLERRLDGRHFADMLPRLSPFIFVAIDQNQDRAREQKEYLVVLRPLRDQLFAVLIFDDLANVGRGLCDLLIPADEFLAPKRSKQICAVGSALKSLLHASCFLNIDHSDGQHPSRRAVLDAARLACIAANHEIPATEACIYLLRARLQPSAMKTPRIPSSSALTPSANLGGWSVSRQIMAGWQGAALCVLDIDR